MADNSATVAAQLAQLGYNPTQIAGIIGNLTTESGLDPTATGDNGTSYGIGQWHGPRFDALKEFAAKNGTDPSDIGTQVRFLHQELQSSEPRALSALQAAKTPEEAATAFLHFERPQGYTPDNPLGSMGSVSRLNAARAFAGGTPVAGAPPMQLGAPATYTASRLPVTATTPGLLGQPDYAASAQGLLAQRAPGQPQATQNQDEGMLKPMGLLQTAAIQRRPSQPRPLSFGQPVRRHIG